MTDHITLLRESAEQFRDYAQQHKNKVAHLADPHAIEQTLAKAAVNTGFAERIEKYLAEESVRVPDIFDKIVAWGAAKGLTDPDRAGAQMIKMVEELGETAGAIARLDKPKMIDGFGDCIVVLTLMAAQQGLPLMQCIEAAWDEIKDRTGKTVDGIFIKDSESA